MIDASGISFGDAQQYSRWQSERLVLYSATRRDHKILLCFRNADLRISPNVMDCTV
jgi:hypothetical protein